MQLKKVLTTFLQNDLNFIGKSVQSARQVIRDQNVKP